MIAPMTVIMPVADRIDVHLDASSRTVDKHRPLRGRLTASVM